MQPLTFKNPPPQRILIIKPSALGDVVHGLPVLARLRRKWPNAHITWLVAPAFAGLLENHPLVNEIIRFDRRGFASAWRNPLALLRLIRFARDLRRRKFDLVIDLQGLFRSGWLTGRTKAAVRIGFASARELAWIYYTHKVNTNALNDHAVTRNLQIASALGCDDPPAEFPLAPAEEDVRHIRDLLASEEPYAVLLPGTNWDTKRWPAKHFAALVEPIQWRLWPRQRRRRRPRCD